MAARLKSPGRLLDPASNVGARGMVTLVALARAPRDRIRLIGSLRHLLGKRMSTYLVTGGAGFIGSHLSAALIARGHRVRVVDSLVTGFQHNLQPGVEFSTGDLADAATAAAAASGQKPCIPWKPWIMSGQISSTTAVPSRPARAVRPERCKYVFTSSGGT